MAGALSGAWEALTPDSASDFWKRCCARREGCIFPCFFHTSSGLQPQGTLGGRIDLGVSSQGISRAQAPRPAEEPLALVGGGSLLNGLSLRTRSLARGGPWVRPRRAMLPETWRQVGGNPTSTPGRRHLSLGQGPFVEKPNERAFNLSSFHMHIQTSVSLLGRLYLQPRENPDHIFPERYFSPRQ